MHPLKNIALAGSMLVSVFVSVPALAEPVNSAATVQSSAEFPGGIHATSSSDANLVFLGNTKKVSQLRLTQGTTTLTVPAGRELKLEVGSLLVQSKTAELEVGFDAASRPQVTCLSGLVGVTDAAGNHFRLGDNSVFSLGADGNSPNVRARTMAVSTPEPAPTPPPVVAPAPSVAQPPVATSPEPERPWAGPNSHSREDEDEDGGYQPPQRQQGPSLGQTILQTLPGLLVNVLPFVLNGNNGYYPGAGYYPTPGYYPGAGYYPYR